MLTLNNTVVGIVTLLIALFQPCQSQPQPGSADNGLQEDACAIQFRIDKDFTLSSFQGAIISAKYHLKRSHAIRVGISGSFNIADNSGLSIAQLDSTRTSTSTSGDIDGYTVEVRTQYLHYLNPDAAVNLFLGGGPLLSYTTSTLDQTESRTPSSTGTYTRSDTRKTGAVGISGFAGVEWFASRSFSLHAEYGCAIQYQWSTLTSESETHQNFAPRLIRHSSEMKEKAWQLYFSNVNFGLSIYF